MKKLVVFYSLEGNSSYIASLISKQTDCDLLEVIPKKNISKSRFMKYLWGGKQVMMKEKPELEEFNINMEEYSTIIIGTPVWAGSYAPAIASFLDQVRIENKRIGIFTTFAGDAGKTYSNLGKVLGEKNIVSTIGFQNPSKQGNQEEIVKALGAFLSKLN